MKKTLLSLIVLSLAVNLRAQNLFPYKLDNCNSSSFCLDCGDKPANVEPAKFALLLADFNKLNNYSKISGKIMLQVLVDSTGKGCVLSHTDVTNNPISQDIVSRLNNFDGWIPAKTGQKIEGRTSINLLMEVNKGVLTGEVQRVDQNAFRKSFDHPADPEIYNKTYVYKNEHLNNYEIASWNSENSNLPDNFNDNIAIDKNNIIWLSIDDGLVKFDGKNFTKAEAAMPGNKKFACRAIAVDRNNVKWVYAIGHIYSFNDREWTTYDPKDIGTDGVYSIVCGDTSDEVLLGDDKGLIIYKDGKSIILDQKRFPEFPSNRVAFAKRDSKNRIWIGTFSGSVLIDENGKAKSFNKNGGVLKGKCITSMDEDEKGNIYLGLFEYDRKDKQAINNDEGIAVVSPNGSVKQYTTANSGMPYNHVTKVLYDKAEKVLWIATDRAGLVRFDLKNGWENYHNNNSKMPTSYVGDMAFDSNGVLYLATRQGLVRVKKK